MSTTQGMSTAERNHLTVVEAHATKDGSDVLVVLRSIRETTIGRAGARVAVLAARTPGNRGALHLLDGARTGEGPQIRVRDPREFGYTLKNVSDCTRNTSV